VTPATNRDDKFAEEDAADAEMNNSKRHIPKGWA
jgi:hypothetical protein